MQTMLMMPTFLIIGAARSGTTALYQYLKQHPEVFMSKDKEPNFFAFENEDLNCQGPGADYINNSVTSLENYRRLFKDASSQQAIGEASPLYLYSEKAPGRIRHHLPDVKLIAVLRNPVEQAFSHFLYAKRQMLEPLGDFESAIMLEEERKSKGWQPLFQYSQFPKYHRQLKRYYDVFPKEQIRVFLYEEFEQNPLSVLLEIHSFIGVDEEFATDIRFRPNAGGIPKSHFLQKMLMTPSAFSRLAGRLISEPVKRRIRDAISDHNLEKPVLPAAARQKLITELDDDIGKLQVLLDRDLSAWLQ